MKYKTLLKSSLCTLLFLLIVLPSKAQVNRISEMEASLVEGFKALRNAEPQLRYDSIVPALKAEMLKVLDDPQTFHYKFDSLAKYVRIVRSRDSIFRIFSWDQMGGGTWHDMDVFAQFKKSDNDVGVKQLDTEKEALEGEYTDVIVYKIHTIQLRDQTHYLTIGWGSHGAGHHHTTLQIFRIDNDKLKKCQNCFETGSDYVVEAPRAYEMEVIYNRKKKKISHNRFKYDANSGFYKPTGDIKTLQLIDGVFQE